jgi:5-methyltetrahydrofolate--homocysteine methyltransferase
MNPASSVSALVFGHKESKYFAVGQINKDQILDYAQRKGKKIEDVETSLHPILGYEKSMN